VRRLGQGRWQQLVENSDLSWKETTLAILEAFTERTNGAVIQNKGSSLVWKYDDVDPEFGSMQAKLLSEHLTSVLAESPVNIQKGKGYIEVRPHGINKGVMVDHIVSELYATSGGIDFILCVGDDSGDEYMFQALAERFNSSSTQVGAPAVYTVVVGQKPSAAQYFVNDHEEVLELCQSLRLHSTRANRNRSLNDLQSHSSKGLWGSPSGSAGRGGGTPPGSGGAPPGSGGAVRMGPLARSLDAQGSSSLVHAHLSSAAAYSAAARRPPPEMVDEGSSVEEWSHRTRPPSMHQKRWDL